MSSIIVVDDDETGKVKAFCESHGVTRVEGVKPFVYARNINRGIKHAYRHPVTIDWVTFAEPEIAAIPSIVEDGNPDGVILLNDDALLQTPGGFTTMARACKDFPEYGLIGATTNVVGNPNQFHRGIGLRSEPRMVCFLCVYIPRTTLQRVGLLDERYITYGLDDDDYSFEVRKAGLKIGVHDACYVDHGSLRSTFRGDPKTPADFQPNMKRFIEKWGTDNWGRPA